MSEQPIENEGVSSKDIDRRPKVNGKYGRRTLMLGAAAGVGAVASLATKPDIAAANGTPVELGDVNSATATTEVTTSSGSGLYGISEATSGITGYVGGVVGDSNTKYGVVGLSSVLNGVAGVTTADSWGGVIGQDESSGGGYGVQGYSAQGVGVSAVATTSSATALQVEGIATFSRSGLVSIAAGKTSAKVTDVALSASSLVLANLQTNLSGVYVEAVVPDVSASSFKIVLSEAVPSGDTASVGWFVVN